MAGAILSTVIRATICRLTTTSWGPVARSDAQIEGEGIGGLCGRRSGQRGQAKNEQSKEHCSRQLSHRMDDLPRITRITDCPDSRKRSSSLPARRPRNRPTPRRSSGRAQSSLFFRRIAQSHPGRLERDRRRSLPRLSAPTSFSLPCAPTRNLPGKNLVTAYPTAPRIKSARNILVM